jgi:hypothetical protein
MLVGDGWQGQENGSIGEVWPLMTSSMPLRRIGRARRISLARALPIHTARMLGKKLFHRKRAHANTGRFNDREMSGPIGPFNDPSGKSGADLRYGRHW